MAVRIRTICRSTLSCRLSSVDGLRSASAPPTAPVVECVPAALMLADLSGFSAAAETLAVRGARGAEDLKDLLNQFFGCLVEAVHRHGGQVLKFPGDATLAVWPPNEEGVESAVRHATQCALEAQHAIRAHTPGLRLDMRAGVGVGSSVGRQRRWRRWEMGASGDRRSADASGPVPLRCQPGRGGGVVEASISSLHHCTDQRLADGMVRVEFVTPLPSSSSPDPFPLGPKRTAHLRAYVSARDSSLARCRAHQLAGRVPPRQRALHQSWTARVWRRRGARPVAARDCRGPDRHVSLRRQHQSAGRRRQGHGRRLRLGTCSPRACGRSGPRRASGV